jgi:hypothetical protein
MSSEWIWRNDTLWSSVALVTRIGIVTRPKLMAPLQMAWGMANLRKSPEQDQPTSGLCARPRS